MDFVEGLEIEPVNKDGQWVEEMDYYIFSRRMI